MKENSRSEDFQLIESAQRNIDAFGALYEKYFVNVFRFIYHKVGDRDLASDLCSQTFLKAMLHLRGYKDKGKPILAWFFMIATNEVRMHYRSSTTQRTIAVEDEHLRALASEASMGEDDDTLDTLIRVLDTLDEASLELIELRFFDKLSFAMIAEIYKTREATVKMRVYRTLDTLKARMSAQRRTP